MIAEPGETPFDSMARTLRADATVLIDTERTTPADRELKRIGIADQEPHVAT